MSPAGCRSSFIIFTLFNSGKTNYQLPITNYPIICVPSGNFGNLAAGILAHISGLPCEKFIAATNANDVIPQFLECGEMKIKSSVATLSNAMDVANPSNFVRILEIFNNDYLDLKEENESCQRIGRKDDQNDARSLRKIQLHSRPARRGRFLRARKISEIYPDRKGFFLETAHAIKFDSVEKIIGTCSEMPETVKNLFEKEKFKTEIEANYEDLKEILLEKFNTEVA